MSTYEEDLAARRAQERLDAEEFRVVAQTIAILLGGAVKDTPLSEDYWCNTRQTISFDDGRAIDLVFQEYNNKGKLRVYGNMPRNASGRTFGKSAGGINVSTSKTPQQIAKDIARRFMPEYTTCYAKAVQQKHESDEYTRKKEARKDLLCTIKGVTRSTCNDSLHVRCNAMYGDIKHVSETGLCNIELSGVSTEQLRVLLGS